MATEPTENTEYSPIISVSSVDSVAIYHVIPYASAIWRSGGFVQGLKSPGGDPISKIQQDGPGNRNIIFLMNLNRSAG